MDKVDPPFLEVYGRLYGIGNRLNVRTGKTLGYLSLGMLKIDEAGQENSLNSFIFISLNADFPYQVVQINFMAVQGEYGKIIGVVRRKS